MKVILWIITRPVYYFLYLICILSISYYSWHFQHTALPPEIYPPELQDQQETRIKHATSLSLTEKQCIANFPWLFDAIDKSVAEGRFNLEHSDDSASCLRGRINNGKIYISSGRHDDELSQADSVLDSLQRAISSSPTRVPNTHFLMSFSKTPTPNCWSFSQDDSNPDQRKPWLMPISSTWHWNFENLDSLNQSFAKAGTVELEVPFRSKVPRAVWRGADSVSPNWNPELKSNLLSAVKDKRWANAQAWNEDKSNDLPIEDMCLYKYILYAETGQLSTRSLFHQLCGSIIITPPLNTLTHTTHLLDPMFSSSLSLPWTPVRPYSHRVYNFPLRPNRVPYNKRTWPISYPRSLANIVFVKPDWSDLEETVKYLDNNPDVAEEIAGRTRDVLVEGGYLSQAAEMCYWRKMLMMWNEMVKIQDKESWNCDVEWVINHSG